MRNKKNIFIFIFFLILVMALVACGESEEEKRIKMKAFVENKCTMCHFSKRIFEHEKSPEEWEALVNRMRSKNPGHISPEEADNIMKYLEETMSKDEEDQ